MEDLSEIKILISQSLRVDRITTLSFAVVFFCVPIILMHANQVSDFFLYYWLLIILPMILFGLYKTFSKVHPVYFDKKFLYWHKNEDEQSLELDRIKSIHITRLRRGNVVRLKYNTIDGEIKRCSWLMAYNEGYPYPRYRTLEQFIQAERSDFKLDGIHRNPCIFSRKRWR